MPFSLQIPYFICYPVTRLVRMFVKTAVRVENQSQESYFLAQYSDTVSRYELHMGGLDIKGKTVLDVGGGLGGRALGWIELGAKRVLTIDINRQELSAGRAIVDRLYPDVADRIEYKHPDEVSGEIGDVAILFDSFEHLTQPDQVLLQVSKALRPGGLVWVGSIGWYNYMASHCGSHVPIPWCQIFFSEIAIIKTIRSILRTPGYIPNIWEQMEGLDRWDNVASLKDRPGEPLNLLSLKQVKRIMRESPLELVKFRVFGFTGKKNRIAILFSGLVKMPVFDELLHSYYTALLVKPESSKG